MEGSQVFFKRGKENIFKNVEAGRVDLGWIVRVDLEKSKPKGEAFCDLWMC